MPLKPMRKPRVVILCSHHPDDQISRFGPDILTVSFPLGHTLNRGNLPWPPSLIIVWDSSKEEKGIPCLEAINTVFPELPLFLAVEDPSREYLIAALRAKVSNFFTLPVCPGELRQAILHSAADNEDAALVENTQNWFWKLQHFARSLMDSFSLARAGQGALVMEGTAASPSSPHIPTRTLEPENVYDISVQFFGNLRILARKKPTPRIKGKKNATVLAYLLYHHHRPTHREILMDRFWRDYTTSSARNSLNVAICSIRKHLSKTFTGQEVIIYDNQSYGINPDLKIITDTEKFIHFWKKGSAIESSQGLTPALEAYHTALSYYKQEFLSNIRFDEWCEYERDNLKEVYLFILNRLSNYFFEQGQYDACINASKKMLNEDSCLEEVHRKLMSCYYYLGLGDLALKQYFKCKKVLEEELSLSPSEPTVELFNQIQKGKFIRV